MRYLSLFSGIEAATLAWAPLGWECVALSEIDPFACAVLEHHYPDTPNLGDVTAITEEQIRELGRIDLVVFGSPCQDLSVAGKRGGLDGKRSGLFYDAMRIVRIARRYCSCRYALWENVPGTFSSNKGRDFAAVVGEMVGCEFGVPRRGWKNSGVGVGPAGQVEWSVLDAKFMGVPQRRRRIFALADFGDWVGRPPILFEPESMRGDLETGGKAGEGVTGTLSARTKGGGGLGTDFESAGGLTACYGKGPDSDACDALVHSTTGSGYWGEGAGTLRGRAQESHEHLVTHSLRADGFDASEDGTGRGTPLVPVTAGTLKANSGGGGWSNSADHAAAGYMIPVSHTDVVGPIMRGADTEAGHNAMSGQSKDELVVPMAFQSKASATNSMNPSPCAPSLDVGKSDGLAVAFAENSRAELRLENGDGKTTGCLNTGGGKPGQGVPAIATPTQVRRLTPIECERLMGVPDDYTKVPYRDKLADQCADGPRYRALGNSMAVPVMRWIGERINKYGAT